MVGSEWDLKMHVRNLWHRIPLQMGPQNHLFQRLHNLTVTLMAYVFEIIHVISNRVTALITTRGRLYRLKMS